MDFLEQLFAISNQFVKNLNVTSKRSLYYSIDWDERLIGILGARGVGKTTLMLQKLKERNKLTALYISLDHPIIASLSLYEIAENFSVRGGEILFLDEVHKYDEWSAHIKSIYDAFPNLKIVFSGSSAIHLQKGRGDLSRRASIYKLVILSFREFLELETKQKFSTYSLNEICMKHIKITENICDVIKPLQYFYNYLTYGNYPFYLEGKKKYSGKLQNIINQVIESDLVIINNIEGRFINKLKKLLYMISVSLPYQPNLLKLSNAIEISRPLLYKYLEYLQEANLIYLLLSEGKGYASLIKPEKIYLDNTNLIFALCGEKSELGNTRETFFISQLKDIYLIESSKSADFFVDYKWTFEIGGKNKTFKQIKDVKDAYIVSDDIEIGFGKKIPLWLFGFLY